MKKKKHQTKQPINNRKKRQQICPCMKLFKVTDDNLKDRIQHILSMTDNIILSYFCMF